jgi:hypothetical protein
MPWLLAMLGHPVFTVNDPPMWTDVDKSPVISGRHALKIPLDEFDRLLDALEIR